MRMMLSLLLATVLFSCSKNKTETTGGCAFATSVIVPAQPFLMPVWHPDGEVIGFNHLPITGIKTSPCSGDYYTVDEDSVGFYLINKDRTGYSRMTSRPLYTPSWSPDGTKLAYAGTNGIYVVAFDGSKLDTANAKRITQGSSDAFPTWTANSDSLYFKSYNPHGSTFMQLVKIAADGTGSSVILTDNFDFPFFGSDKRIYFVYNSKNIVSTDQSGADRQQLATSTRPLVPKYFDGKIYFQDETKLTFINAPAILHENVQGFDISKNGEIVFSNYQRRVLHDNKQNGALWIMNADGSNKRQLTFNNY